MRLTSPRPSPTDAERALTALRRLVRALRTGATGVRRGVGISGAQLFVLRELVRQPGRSMHELMAATLTTQSTVSEVVARLIERGLVSRETAVADRRRAILTPTAAGRALVRRAPPVIQADLIAALRRLPATTRRTLANGLEQWLAVADLAEAPAPMFFEPARRSRAGASR
jgi:DNA-binding MarR family transcriptional regulator